MFQAFGKLANTAGQENRFLSGAFTIFNNIPVLHDSLLITNNNDYYWLCKYVFYPNLTIEGT